MRGMKLPRFSLKALFAAVTMVGIAAGMLAWRHYALDLMAKRHEKWSWIWITLEFQMRPGIRDFSYYHKTAKIPPWFLRFWGETLAIDFIEFDTDKLVEAERHNIDEFKRLFPEATVTAKKEAEWGDTRN